LILYLCLYAKIQAVRTISGVILNTIWLSISSGNGPEECAYAASLTVKVLLQEIQNLPEKGITAEDNNEFSLSDVRFETAKARGPGGQNVNKTESAVRAVHIPTGKSATARGERSQLLNKKLALARLASLFVKEKAEKNQQNRSDLRHSHWELERGNPVRVYDGETMKLLKRNKE